MLDLNVRKNSHIEDIYTNFIQKLYFFKLKKNQIKHKTKNSSTMAPTPTTNHTIASANSPSDPMLKLRDLLSSIQPPSAASPQNSKGHDHDEEDAVAVVATEVEVEVEVQQGDGSSKEDRMLDLSVLKYGDLIVFRSMSCNRNVSCRVPDGSGKCVAESELYQGKRKWVE